MEAELKSIHFNSISSTIVFVSKSDVVSLSENVNAQMSIT